LGIPGECVLTESKLFFFNSSLVMFGFLFWFYGVLEINPGP
jgi:hypothetical protein